MAYQHTNTKGTTYHLHSSDVKLRSGRTQRIYYFAKQPGTNAVDAIPDGFKVVENERTGLPVLKKG